MAESVRESVTAAVEGGGRTVVQKWTGQIAAYDREFAKWEERVERILKRYRDDDRGKNDNTSGPARFNVLWANVQTLVPATYSRVPKPDVSRRFRDSDPVGRVAANLLERALDYETQHYPDFRTGMKSSVLDRFLGGRGMVWARYEPHIRAIAGEPQDGAEVTEDTDAPAEELDYECAPVDYVHWRDFGHTVARSWDEVTAVWRRVYMTREACIERFGDKVGAKIPLDSVPDDLKKNSTQAGGNATDMSRACVYEIWDKLKLKAYWISKSMPEVLDEKDDPLELEGFYPCPKPLYSTMTNESLIPVPDFALYQDQAKELDTLSDRIQGLIEMLQVKGVYDASVPELARLFTEGANGNLLPVKNWAAFAEKAGLAGAIDIVDLKPIYEALRAAYEAVAQVMKQIYDLTGLADIVRGQSEASETATAQQIKGQYASLRLKALQADVAVFASQILQLKAQIICGNFAPETIAKMAAAQELSQEDQQYVPAAIALLIGPERTADPVNGGRGDNPMRAFRIEVNSDTMVQLDEEQEKTARMEFLTAIGTFMKEGLPIAQVSPQIAPLIMQLLKFAVGAFKVGKSIEGAFDQAIDQLSQAAKQPQQPKPDPEMEKVKADAEADKARLAADQQAEQAKLQAEMQAEQQRVAMEAQENEKRLQMEAQAEQQRIQQEQWAEQQRMFMERQAAVQQARDDMMLAKFEAMLKERTAIRTAEINADASVEVAKHAPKPEAASG